MQYLPTITPNRRKVRRFLFLQGPVSPFFAMLATALREDGHEVRRINLCFGDFMTWRGAGAVNYRGSFESWAEYVGAFMEREGITDLFLLGEQRPYHLVAIAEAKKRSIKVMVTDFGYLRPDWITLEENGMSGQSLFPRDAEAIREIAAKAPPADLTHRYKDCFQRMAMQHILHHIGNLLFAPLYPGYRSHEIYQPLLALMATGVRLTCARFRAKQTEDKIADLAKREGPFYLVPLQMETDYQIRAYSPFTSQRQMVELVLASFAKSAPSRSELIFKVHPYDPGLTNWRTFIARGAADLGVADRVTYLDGGPPKQLFDMARGVITVNSTMGLSALKSDCPVITLGEAVYDVDGLTFQGGLDRFWQDAKAPDHQLLDDFIQALVAKTQIKGVFFAKEGLAAAVAATARILAPKEEPLESECPKRVCEASSL